MSTGKKRSMERLMVVATALLLIFPETSAVPTKDQDALFLTEFIKDGRIKAARERSLVTGFGCATESYSGYLTVDEKYNSNLFFWFFPAETDPSNAPLLLWLNGGPGVSSLIGAFLENGPLAYGENGTLERREYAWTKHFSMLYIDSPVGTGYSFTDDDAGMSTSIEDVTVNLYSALVQFFKLFPAYSSRDFYVGGQSYAGKYVPALGKYIYDRNNDSSVASADRINFKGIYLGGGFCDPPTMLPVYADALFYYGLLSSHDSQSNKDAITAVFQRAKEANTMDLGDFSNVFGFNIKFMTPTCPLPTDNLLGCEATNSLLVMEMEEKVFTSKRFRKAFHVGEHPLKNKPDGMLRVQIFLMPGDFIRNTNSENAFLMDNSKVLHYSGNLDVTVSTAMSEAFLSQVQWSGRHQYAESSRQKWFVNKELAGWFTVVGNLTRVIVRNAGHMTPYDQPRNTLEMMKSFIFDKPFEIK